MTGPRLARRTAVLRADGATGWEVHEAALARRQGGEPVIILSVGDHDFATPPELVAAAVAGLQGGQHHYTPLAGLGPLRAAIAARVAAETGVATAREQVIVTPGAQGALYACAQCLLDPGDEAVLVAPYYVTYPATLRAAGAELRIAASDPDRGFALDPAAIAAAITPRTRLVLLNTPNNPSGAVYDAAALAEVAALCRARDLWLVTDEVYAALVHDGRHVSMRTLPGMAERTVVVASFSKSHAMTGWRLGYAIAPAALVARMTDLALVMLYGLPGFTQQAALAALDAPAIAARIAALYRERRDVFVAALRAGGVAVTCPAAGMNVMLDVRRLGRPEGALAEALLAAEGVSLLPGSSFGPSSRGFLRASLAVAPAALGDAARRIARFMAAQT